MPSPTDNGAAWPSSTPDSARIREQLRRLLAHPLFLNSKRYPVFLAYVVDQTLKGHAAALKERTVGAEAFGRQADYDVNLDPVVRMTAAEVRKRLAQYYYSPGHAAEVVIELPVGSYVPVFRESLGTASTESAELREGDGATALAAEAAAEPPSNRSDGVRPWHIRATWLAVTAGMMVAAGIGFWAGRAPVLRQHSDLERFWEPIVAASGQVTYCLGELAHSVDQEPPPQSSTLGGDLYISDVITLAGVLPLVRETRPFRVVRASDAAFAQLRDGPVVLIGAYNNEWTMRLTQDLAFRFEFDAVGRRIVERKHPAGRSWTIKWRVPSSEQDQDFALVARFHDRVTGQPVIILAGILGPGTEAAGELVSNATYLDVLLKKAPPDWARLNLAAVIGTRVIDGHPGPPTVIAVDTW